MNNKELLQKIEEIVTPIIEARGLELIDVEYVNSKEGMVLRIYIDKDKGVTLKDCEDVSIMLSSVLDTYDLINEKYFLEISSPGLYRELKKEKDFIRYIGYRVKVKLYQPLDEIGERVFFGKLKEYNNNTIKIELDNKKVISLELKNVAKINLEPDLSELLKEK